jgi:hypothetical protein
MFFKKAIKGLGGITEFFFIHYTESKTEGEEPVWKQNKKACPISCDKGTPDLFLATLGI